MTSIPKFRLYSGLIAIQLAILIGVSSCQSPQNQSANPTTSSNCTTDRPFPEEYGTKQKHTLVFIDLTDTTIYGSSALSYLKQVLEKRLTTAEFVKENIKPDKLQIFFISANTATTQTTSIQNLELRTSPLGMLVEGQDIVNAAKKKRYLCSIDEFLDHEIPLINSQIKKIQQKNQDINSDVLGLFFIANREFERSTAEDKAIFVISDMEHFCNNGGYFRCNSTRICSSGCNKIYQSGNPSNDAQVIKKKLERSESLKDVAFHYMRGDRPIGTTNQEVLNFIQDYWKNLISELGLKEYTKIS